MKKILGIVLTLLGLLLSALFIAYLIMDKEHSVLDADSRSQLGGHYIQLEKGVVHYELAGNEELKDKPEVPTVVLVHGFSSPLYVFDPTTKYLQEKKFRVLRFDLFGRGFSDRLEDSDYGLDLYVEQIRHLLLALNISTPVHIVGLSMGGAVVTHFTNKYPEMVNKVALIAPLFHTPERPEVALVKTPGLGELLGKVVLVPRFINGVSETVYDPNSFPNWSEKFSPQTEYKGFSLALVQTARYLAGKSFRNAYTELGKSDKPLLLIWGENDQVLPFSDSDLVRQALPNSDFHRIEQAGHLPHYEQPAQVNPLLANFFSAEETIKQRH